MKKIKQLFLILILLIFPVGLVSQKFTGSLLWEVSGNGLKYPSYILGSYHAKTIEYLDSIPHAKEKFANSTQIIGEVDLTELNNSSKLLMSQMFLPDSVSYSDFMSSEEIDLLNSLLINNIGVGLNQGFGKMKPAALSQTITIMMVLKILGIDSSTFKPIDQVLLQKGADMNKEIKGLETLQFQCDLLFNYGTYTEQAENLLCSLTNMENVEQDLIRLTQTYNNADLNGLYAMSMEENAPCSMPSDFMDKLNKYRNNDWMTKIPTMIADQPSFIVIGCLHLAGKEGILNQLHALGYTVKAVK